MLLKHVVLIIGTINVIMNMGEVRQKGAKEGPILKLNKRFK